MIIVNGVTILGPAYACVDEMLVAFRVRCKFRMYCICLTNLPNMALTDVWTHYLFNAFIYTGKNCYGKGLDLRERELSKLTQSVLQLAKPTEGSRRNITADNWFSSIQLAQELKIKDLAYVETVKKNKTEIPRKLLPDKDWDELSSLYGFTEDMTLMSYDPKVKKSVIMLSTMHYSISDGDTTGKPEIIAFWQQYKRRSRWVWPKMCRLQL